MTIFEPSHLFRFRSIKHLLGDKQELEKQEIFFSSREKLNDPMEGFKDYFWEGDEIIWKNLLKNYLISLEHICELYHLLPVNEFLTVKDIPTHISIDDLRTNERKRIFHNIHHEFFSHELVKVLPKWLSDIDYPIRKQELEYHLRQIHFVAVDLIFRNHIKEGLSMPRKDDNILRDFGEHLLRMHLKLKLPEMMKEKSPDSFVKREKFFASLNESIHQTHLNHSLESGETTTKNQQFVLHDFPSLYIQALERIACEEWYTASFLDNCVEPSLWGYYGDNHKGVCLIFKTYTEGERRLIKLNGVNGYGGDKNSSRYLRNKINFEFYKVNYSTPHPDLNFFNSIGKICVPKLMGDWYTNDKGDRSKCSEGYILNEKQWIANYWDMIIKSATTKMGGWMHECEHRLVLTGFLDYSIEANRKCYYDLEDLAGIVFGINTTASDKLKILEILNRKAKTQKGIDLKFYQAYHFPKEPKMTISELSFLRIRS